MGSLSVLYHLNSSTRIPAAWSALPVSVPYEEPCSKAAGRFPGKAPCARGGKWQWITPAAQAVRNSEHLKTGICCLRCIPLYLLKWSRCYKFVTAEATKWLERGNSASRCEAQSFVYWSVRISFRALSQVFFPYFKTGSCSLACGLQRAVSLWMALFCGSDLLCLKWDTWETMESVSIRKLQRRGLGMFINCRRTNAFVLVFLPLFLFCCWARARCI